MRAKPSLVEHFWSLSIEEQLYLFLPPVVLGALTIGRGRRRVLAGILALLVAAAAVATFRSRSSDLVYYGTHTRAAELLVGALLAILVSNKRIQPAITSRTAGLSRLIGWAGVVAAVGTLGLWMTASASGVFVRRGGLLVTSVLSVVLIIAALSPRGPLGLLLSTRPLRWLGKTSYGIYLFHWPIMVWLRATRLPSLVQFIAAISATLVLAAVSHRFLEQPLRQRVWPHMRFTVVAAAGFLIAGIFVLPATSTKVGFDAGAIQARLAAIAATARAHSPVTSLTSPTNTSPTANGAAGSVPSSSSVPVSPTPGASIPGGIPKVAIAGDSVAFSLEVPLATWAAGSDQGVFVAGPAIKGCGFTRTVARNFAPNNQTTPPGCRDWLAKATELDRREHPDVTVLVTGLWDLIDAKIPGGGDAWRTYGDPVYERFVYNDLLAVTDAFAARGSLVVWLTTPDINQTDLSVVGPKAIGSDQYVYSGVNNPRVQRLNNLVQLVVAARPRTARMIDFHQWMASRYADTGLRPDGMHYDPNTSANVGTSFLGPQITSLYAAWHR